MTQIDTYTTKGGITMSEYDKTIDDELAQWDEDEEISNGVNADETVDYAEIVDGHYTVTIEGMVLKRSKTSNAPMVEWALRIKKPNFVNRKLWKYSMLNNKIGVKIFVKELKSIGIDLDKVSDTRENISKAVGLTVAIRKQTKGEYENIYINGIVKETGSYAQNEDTSPPIDDNIEDDIPF